MDLRVRYNITKARRATALDPPEGGEIEFEILDCIEDKIIEIIANLEEDEFRG